MITVLLLHLIIAALAPSAARRLGPRVFWLCAVAPAAALVWVLISAAAVLDRGQGPPLPQPREDLVRDRRRDVDRRDDDYRRDREHAPSQYRPKKKKGFLSDIFEFGD